MNTVLITGASGFIGSRLAADIAADTPRVYTDAALGGEAVARLTDARLAALCGGNTPDLILHAAGSGTVAQVAADPALALPANLAATLQVLEFARRCAPRAHVVLLSSAAVYGNAPAEAQLEQDARTPVSLYGVSKAQSEQLLSHYASQFGLRSTAVRLFSVYGPGLRKQLLWDAMNKFAGGQGHFFGTGQERRDWVHIDDVCRFMRALAVHPGAAGRFDVFNCGGEAATTAEVLTHLAEVSNAPLPQFNGQTRAGDPVCLRADIGKAAAELLWRPRVGWREGVAGYARWFSAQAAAGASSLPAVPREAGR